MWPPISRGKRRHWRTGIPTYFLPPAQRPAFVFSCSFPGHPAFPGHPYLFHLELWLSIILYGHLSHLFLVLSIFPFNKIHTIILTMTSLSLLKRKPYTLSRPKMAVFLSFSFVFTANIFKDLLILSAPFTPSTNSSIHINQNSIPSLLPTILSKGTNGLPISSHIGHF